MVQTHPLPEAPWILSLLSSESIYGDYYCYYDGGVSTHADLITREPSAGGGRRRESDTILSRGLRGLRRPPVSLESLVEEHVGMHAHLHASSATWGSRPKTSTSMSSKPSSTPSRIMHQLEAFFTGRMFELGPCSLFPCATCPPRRHLFSQDCDLIISIDR